MKAKELMHAGTPWLPFDAQISEAIEYLKSHHHGFAAICASEDRVHGVLTEGGLVRIFLKYQTQSDKDVLIYYRDCFEPVQLIHENEDFSAVVKKVMTAVGNRVFVIDDKGRVNGHITAKDLLPHFSSKRTEAPVHSDLYLYENFFTKSPFLMHSANPSGEIQMANEMLHTVLGYQYGELIGKKIFSIYPKESHKLAEEGLKTIIKKGYHDVIKAKMVHRDGHEIEVEMMSRALTDPAGQSIGTVTVSRPLDMQFLMKSLGDHH